MPSAGCPCYATLPDDLRAPGVARRPRGPRRAAAARPARYRRQRAGRQLFPLERRRARERRPVVDPQRDAARRHAGRRGTGHDRRRRARDPRHPDPGDERARRPPRRLPARLGFARQGARSPAARRSREPGRPRLAAGLQRVDGSLRARVRRAPWPRPVPLHHHASDSFPPRCGPLPSAGGPRRRRSWRRWPSRVLRDEDPAGARAALPELSQQPRQAEGGPGPRLAGAVAGRGRLGAGGRVGQT